MSTLSDLTPRQREVAMLLSTGCTNAEIGHKLGIGMGTVKIHMKHIFAKLGLKSRVEVALWASRAEVT